MCRALPCPWLHRMVTAYWGGGVASNDSVRDRARTLSSPPLPNTVPTHPRPSPPAPFASPVHFHGHAEGRAHAQLAPSIQKLRRQQGLPPHWLAGTDGTQTHGLQQGLVSAQCSDPPLPHPCAWACDALHPPTTPRPRDHAVPPDLGKYGGGHQGAGAPYTRVLIGGGRLGCYWK